MNQILYTGGKKKNSGPLDIKTVLRIFCISIMIFGAILLGEGVYGVVKSITTEPVQISVPEVTITKEGNDLYIVVTHDKPIAKLVYNWNNETNKVIMGDGTNYLEQQIKLPNGNNTLNITVTDNQGNQSTYKKEYVIDTQDTQDPKIEFVVVGSEIKIVATDETELLYVTYKWNLEPETTVNVTPENPTTIETTIEIPKGENELIVTAVDSSNNTQTKTQKVKGVTKPKVNVTKDGEYLIIEVTDEEGMGVVDYTLNGKKYRLQFTDETGKIISYRQKLDIGDNFISLTAYNKAGVSVTFEGQCTYIP